MKRSPLQSSRFRNACKIAVLAAAIGSTLAPGNASACPRFCPFFEVESCVMSLRDGMIFTTWTNRCLACKAGLRYLYAGACKFGWGPPHVPVQACPDGSCLKK
jgi:hypothetical protein